jgi:hypothetical protein
MGVKSFHLIYDDIFFRTIPGEYLETPQVKILLPGPKYPDGAYHRIRVLKTEIDPADRHVYINVKQSRGTNTAIQSIMKC